MSKIDKLQKIKTLFLPIIVLGLVSCVSLNSHQTGRTVGDDNLSIFGNFNFGYPNSYEHSIIEDSGAFYVAEIGTLYGIKENLDLGFKINSSFHFTGLSKFQFIGNKKSLFASSIGLDIGANPVGLFFQMKSYSGSLSLFNSFHPTDFLAITLAPSYTYLGIANLTDEYDYSRSNNIYGHSAGFIIGKKHQFSFELSQYVNNTNFSFDTKPIISLGYIWKFKY